MTSTVDAPVPARRRGFRPLRVAAVDPLCEDAAAVTFEVPPELAAEFAFRPGQSLALRRTGPDGEQRRSYSICAAAGDRPRIGVRVVPGGLFSSWLVHEVRPGDVIDVLPPSGSFTPDLGSGGQHVLIAAGSGITPLLSIAASLLRETTSEVVLVYGNRRSDTVMFADELADLKDRYPARLDLVHVLSREPREAELLSGRLDPDRLRALLGTLVPVDETAHWWLCGPHGLVDGAREVLAGLGIDPARVHRELFHVDEPPPEPVRAEDAPPPGARSEVTLVLDGRTSALSLARDVPVLDGAQRSRPDLPFACKGGVCGTCRAKVTAGEVVLRRNFALEQAELDAGYVLTCQSLPVTDQLTVDFDG
ncbi:1,2-phenylacetyl-CoA epoxidase subunit PaaE [Saccharopolyspora sp. MS10]|uniref:1,2-phenylacetyl-CoA epoxidase subunit PaaE n=1 Tax=Saccharopolyspora sp. MS10 TaxID=3385973 RepID=UPI00399F6740